MTDVKIHIPEHEVTRLNEASNILLKLSRNLGVLSSLKWSPNVQDDFFNKGARELPIPVYEVIDTQNVADGLEKAKDLIDGSSPVHDWLRRICDSIENAAGLIRTRGTAEFFDYSDKLYGTPTCLFRDEKTSARELAEKLNQRFARLNIDALIQNDTVERQNYTAKFIKDYLDPRVQNHFGADAPTVRIVEGMASKAAASRSYISLREGAVFTDLDAPQLLLHEAHVHIATSVNGLAHDQFKVLGANHPMITKTQEGLAVFSEIIGGAVDPYRMQRLVDRVLAVQMSIDGADFLQVYHDFYRPRSASDQEAFNNTQRIFRGGLLTGGAPFTKDAIYLEGLIRVHNYMRVAMASGNPRYLHYLFYGKLDLDDIEAIQMLDEQQLLKFPDYLPPWMQDMRLLTSVIHYQSLFEGMDLDAVHESYKDVF